VFGFLFLGGAFGIVCMANAFSVKRYYPIYDLPPSSPGTLGCAVCPPFVKFTGYHSTYHILGSEVEKLAFNAIKRGVKMAHTISM